VIPRACHSCQAPNDPRRRYCGACGSGLIAVCGRCGFDNEHADRFCGLCGDGILVGAGVRPAPVTSPSKVRAPRATQGFTDADLERLAMRHAVATPDSALPNRMSQDDLDSLFGSS
jgi:hypothetical protein